jgi:hypothetical protein
VRISQSLRPVLGLVSIELDSPKLEGIVDSLVSHQGTEVLPPLVWFKALVVFLLKFLERLITQISHCLSSVRERKLVDLRKLNDYSVDLLLQKSQFLKRLQSKLFAVRKVAFCLGLVFVEPRYSEAVLNLDANLVQYFFEFFFEVVKRKVVRRLSY